MAILCIAGPTASGKSKEAIVQARSRGGEIISVDARQVYRGLDVGTEKVPLHERGDIPHHLLDIREPEETYSAGDFVRDAARLIKEIRARGKTPILAGGTHFYFDALLNGLPAQVPMNPTLRTEIAQLTTEELYKKIKVADPVRADALDPKNRRRLVRAFEIIAAHGRVPKRIEIPASPYEPEWIVINPPKEVLRARINTRLQSALNRGLIEEVRRVRERVGDERLNELGLEYRIVGEYLRRERSEESLFPTLSAKLWQYARRQKSWLRKIVTASTCGTL